jgi:hypothetical protein
MAVTAAAATTVMDIVGIVIIKVRRVLWPLVVVVQQRTRQEGRIPGTVFVRLHVVAVPAVPNN